MNLKDEITSALGIEPSLLIAHIIAVIIIFLILYFLVWKKVIKFIEKRENDIKNEITSARELNKQAKIKEKKIKKELLDASLKAKEILGEAHIDANNIRQKIVNKATKDANNILSNAKIMLVAERESQKKIRRREAINIAFKISETLLQREITKKDHDELIKGFVKDIEQFNEE